MYATTSHLSPASPESSKFNDFATRNETRNIYTSFLAFIASLFYRTSSKKIKPLYHTQINTYSNRKMHSGLLSNLHEPQCSKAMLARLGVLTVMITTLIVPINTHAFYRNDSTNVLNYNISFDETIPQAQSLDQLSWVIIDSNDNIAFNGIGDELYSYTFKTPGVFTIRIEQQEADTHKHGVVCTHPTYPKCIHVVVSPIKVQFVHDEITFSGDIVSNQDNSSTTLQVPVNITTFNNLIYPIHFDDVKVHGIKSKITAVPLTKEMHLASGKVSITYQLQGIAEQKDAILMFDFCDPNRTIQSYTLLNPVK